MGSIVPVHQQNPFLSSTPSGRFTTRSGLVVTIECCYESARTQLPQNRPSRLPSEGVELLSPFPDELWIRILRHLSPEELIRAQRVCREMQRLVQDRSLWDPICSRLNPPMVLSAEQSPVAQYQSYLSALAWLDPATETTFQEFSAGQEEGVKSAQLTVFKGEAYVVSLSKGQTIRVWSVSTGACIQWLPKIQSCRSMDLTILNCQPYIIRVIGYNIVNIWNLVTDDCRTLILEGAIGQVKKVKPILLGDELYIIGTSDHEEWGIPDATISIWSASTGKRKVKFEGHLHAVNSIALVDLGEVLHIVTASSDHTARIWEVESGVLTRVLEHKDEVKSAKPIRAGDEIFIITRHDDILSVWDLHTGIRVGRHSFWANNGRFRSLDFAVFYDTLELISIDNSGSIDIWDLSTDILIQRLVAPSPAESAELTFLNNELCIVSTHENGAIRIWRQPLSAKKIADHQQNMLPGYWNFLRKLQLLRAEVESKQ